MSPLQPDSGQPAPEQIDLGRLESGRRGTDAIRLRGMRFYGYHGALPAERELGQRFEVDVELTLDLRPAGQSDDLARTVNYAAVYDDVRQMVEGPPCRLIEALAERIAARVLADYPPVLAVGVRVRKPAAPVAGILETVEVEIERSRIT